MRKRFHEVHLARELIGVINWDGFERDNLACFAVETLFDAAKRACPDFVDGSEALRDNCHLRIDALNLDVVH